jgi:hypothetical protein
MIRLKGRDYKQIVQRILGIMQEQRQLRRSVSQCEEVEALAEESTFYIFRTDTQTVLAKGIKGYQQAKETANRFRQAMNLRWDQISFKAERQTPTPKRFGVSPNGRSFTNARGDTGRVDYANRFNRSKGSRFKGYTDSQGNFHDLS